MLKVKGWFTENHTPYVALAIRIKKVLYQGRSKFQRIRIIDTYEFGRILLLDELVMLTDRDEFMYHEMMTHTGLFTHPQPSKILVIGAGDGGILREVAKHKAVKSIQQAEIDEKVIEISRRFFPRVASAYSDPRLQVFITDGFAFVGEKRAEYDLVIVDSTDPIGPGKILFQSEFYRRIHRALKPEGILIAQVGTPFYDAKHVRRTFARLNRIFPKVFPYMIHVPTYTDGYYCLAFASKQHHPLSDFSPSRVKRSGLKFKYYNPGTHRGSFMVPTYVATLMPAATRGALETLDRSG